MDHNATTSRPAIPGLEEYAFVRLLRSKRGGEELILKAAKDDHSPKIIIQVIVFVV
mgnify:CR=1 FL=1